MGDIPTVEALISDKVLANRLQVAVVTVLVVNYVQTFKAEMCYYRSAPWSLVKFLFIIARYSAFLDAASVTAYFLLPIEDPSPVVCKTFQALGTMSFLATVALTEGILFIRVYAVSARNRFVLIWLSTQYVLVHCAEFALMGILVANTQFPTITGITEYIGCTVIPPSNHGMLLRCIFGLLVLNAGVLVLLMGWMGLVRFRHAPASALVETFFRDGLGYFLVIASVAVINIVANVRVTMANFILAEAQGIFHSILACRLVLHLRKVGLQGVNADYDPSHMGAREISTTRTLDQFGQPQLFPLIEIKLTTTQVHHRE
ncbi:hypothetical protein FA15DRAFT_707251 [Coprinopsis marcescibilis]|uniref:DUF6533 domain-containing protein n=1 Tax=Coprinopsis marcescibilis TaxID=230819 RepID=A0A5C3KM13_COPMA|nr:hypothetical protein FA15DRAFT_707251 [Coprinopsis marcescibilis]